MKKILFYSVLTFTVTIIFITSSFASLFLKVEFSELVKKAEAIVYGKVIDVKSDWNSEHTGIYTYATLKIEKVFKGNISLKEIVIKEFGGQVGEYKAEPIGFPKLRIGEESIIFLSRWQEDGNYRILEYCQGKYNVITERGKKLVIREDVTQGDTSIMGSTPSNDPFAIPIEYNKFVANIEASVK